MVCRNRERGEAAVSKIHSTTGNENVHLEVYMFCYFYKTMKERNNKMLMKGSLVIFGLVDL